MLLIDIFKKYVMNESNEKLFDSTEDFMDEYISDAQNIDYEIVRLYGQRDFYNPFEDTVDTYVYWKKCWDAFIHRRKNMFQKAWNSLSKEYDFDNNYSRHSTVNSTNTGRVGSNYSANTTNNYSSKVNGIHSANIDTNYLGEEKTHTTVGQGIVDTVHGEVPYDKTEYKNVSKDTSTTHERVGDNNLSYENRQDKVTENRNDNVTDTKQDTTVEERNNTVDENKQNNVVEDTYGNTGIYSPTVLLENEYVFRIKKDFYIDVISQFINEVTIYL